MSAKQNILLKLNKAYKNKRAGLTLKQRQIQATIEKKLYNMKLLKRFERTPIEKLRYLRLNKNLKQYKNLLPVK